ncbi:MAG: cysteine desulfurase family protein [Lacipirellulaceae bacterium]
MRATYLDYNATTPLAPRVQESMLPYLAERYADPTGSHAASRAVAEAIEDARTRVAWAIGAAAGDVVFTSGATESCNLALRGLIEPLVRAGDRPHLIVSAVDHAAVRGPARWLASIGAEVSIAPCDALGLVAPESVMSLLRPSTRLVAVVHANDEVGAIQPIAAIAARCREEGVLLHVDASQTLGKTPLDVATLGADLVSLSAHKAYGPKGVGALWVRSGVAVEPQMWGVGQEHGQRSGMPNVVGVVGFGHAAALATECLAEATQRMARLRDLLEAKLLESAGAGLVLGPTDERRLPNTLCLALPGVAADVLLAATPDVLAASCASGGAHVITLGPTLRAMNADPAAAQGAVRYSLGSYTDEEEIDRAAVAIVESWRQLA